MAYSRRQKKNRAVPQLDLRIVVISGLMMAVLGLVSVRLYYLQVIKNSEFIELADRNRIRLRRVTAPRGLVFDRRHRPLVDTRPSFNAVMVPEDSPDVSRTVAHLQTLLGQNDILDKLSAADDEGRPEYEPVTVDERLEWPQVVALETHQLELPGVSLEITPARHYLYGSLAAHLLGYVGEVDRNDLMKASYKMGDEIGKFGLERGWEPFLRGEAGGQEIEVDSVGRRLRVLKEIPDHPGNSIVLTLDLDVQQAAEQAMQGKMGALIALDPNNGDILAMASNPAFDPDIFGGGVKAADWRKLMTDPDHPLQNRVIQGVYPPGSTFKIVDSIAGMQERTLSPETTYYCNGGLWFGGRTYHCWRHQGHGAIQLHRAIVSSCDVFFYQVGEKVGIDKLSHWAHLLGLGEHSGIALDNEKAGTMPSSAWKYKRFRERWYPAETLSVAIGQGYVATTPLQMAQVAEAVANGGIRYRPQFVREVEGLDGHATRNYEPIIESRIDFDPQVLTEIRNAMSDVVNGVGGTGHKCKLDGIEVCGKSGTAQVVGNKAANLESGLDEDKIPYKYRDNGWFIAFAPKDHPQIAVACIIEHGGHGGSSAAPVIHDVMKRFFELYPPNPATTPDLVNATPDTTKAESDTSDDSSMDTSDTTDDTTTPAHSNDEPTVESRRLMPTVDRRMLGHFDWTLFFSVLALASIGMLSVISASYANYHHALNGLVTRQFLWVFIGSLIMVGALFFDYRAIVTYAYPIYVASLGLLIAVSVIGHSTGGSRRWINLGFFHLEPSELAKLAIVLVMVRYLREEPPGGGWRLRQMIIPGVLLGVPAALVLKQPDLGTALVLVLVSVTLIFVSGLNWRTMAMLGLAAMLAAPLSWHYLKPYQRQRLVSFIDPKADPLGSGYHIIQSEIAIGAGGTWGKGFMKGTQARLNFLPEETTDFIFAVFAEDFGMIGSMLLLALYASLIARGAWIARHARDRFGSLLALGLTGIVFWQVAINIAMTTGMLPVVGIPLPLVSYGGSSVLTMMTAMGLLISINARRRTH